MPCGGGSLTNAGSIVGSSGTAVQFGGTAGNLLVLEPGYGFSGKVVGSTSAGASNTLQLASAASVGTIGGLGTEFLNFANVTIDAGANWAVTGSNVGSVTLAAGAGVTNAAGSDISDPSGSAVFAGHTGAGVSVVNAGGLTSSGLAVPVVDLLDGGRLSNAATGTITASADVAVYVAGSAGTLLNDGGIGGVNGVDMIAGGSVTNTASAAIAGQDDGVAFLGSGGTAINYGSIAGSTEDGIVFEGTAAASVTNAIAASISGFYGVSLIESAGAALLNDGRITGTGVDGFGVNANAGQVTNLGSGSITGSKFGASLYFGSTLTNAGTIIGNSGTAVNFFGTQNNLLVLDPGYGFSGVVIGSASASNVLELASAASAGVVGNFSGEFTNFGSIVFDTGADWKLVSDRSALTGPISGFAPGDTIEIIAFNATRSSFSNGTLTLQEPFARGFLTTTLDLPGIPNTAIFDVTHSGAATEVTIACFCAGTRVLTAMGEVRVEDLRIGDPVVTRSGRLRPVRWIGHRRVEPARLSDPWDGFPVRIAADAFAAGVPHRDLLLSPDHALYSSTAR